MAPHNINPLAVDAFIAFMIKEITNKIIECNKKGKYAQNKYLSIEYTKEMIKDEEDCFFL